VGLTLLLAAPAVAAPRKAPVARIVFIGKAKACPCTTKQIAEAWKALHQALGKRPIPVARIQADRKPAEADRYRPHRAWKALPAIYFLTSKGGIIDLLQGIVDEADVRQVLDGR
jgi:hypothetical protein